MTFAIAPYPLTQAARTALEARYGGIVYYSIPELRWASIWSAITQLGAHRGQLCILPLEDPSSAPLVPLLAGTAMFAAPREIRVARAGVEDVVISKSRAAASLAQCGTATFDGQRALRRSS